MGLMRDYRSEMVWWPLSQVIPYANNTKKHPDSQVAKIAAAIAEFGFDQPIVVDGEGVIIKGHGRLLAARQLGMATVPILVRTDLSPAQVKAARISDNRIAQSEWDHELLKIEFAGLQALDFDLDLTGFDAAEWGDLLAMDEPNVKPAGDDAPVPAEAAQERWQVQPGDLWVCGAHRILCGDSAQAENWVRLREERSIDLLLTDPPYGIQRDKGFAGSGGFGGKGKPIPRRQYSDAWDSERPTRETFDLLLSLAPQHIIWGGNFFADLLPMSKHWLVWDKNNTMPTFGDCELAWTSSPRSSVKKYAVEFNGLIGKEKVRYHPTQKPLKLFSAVLEDYSEPHAVIADAYGGSGTTLMACEALGRCALLIEMSPTYVAATLERWSGVTGEVPIRHA